MAAKRRKPASSTRKRSPGSYEPRPQRIRVSFVGREIDAALARISKRSKKLPRQGRAAIRVAARTLRACRREIQLKICDAWILK